LAVFVTAYLCGWLMHAARDRPPGRELLTLWDFSKTLEGEGSLRISALAGVFAFPIFLLLAFGRSGRQRSLVEAIIAHAVTVFIAVLTTLVMIVGLSGGH
jgi:hypothetical protein